MSVASTVTLPAQPVLGNTELLPLGGAGVSAPHGCYVVRNSIVGDASGGIATLTINMDPRYTNLTAWVNARVSVDAAAGDFAIFLQPNATKEGVQIVGTIPQIATTSAGVNAAFLWYPPPLYYRGGGFLQCVFPNVGAGETYTLSAQFYTFVIDVTQRSPLPILQFNVPGVSAPAAV